MLGPPVWALVAGVLLALSPGRAGGAPRAGRRPARARGCADRPEELLEQLYGRLAAGVLGAFHHTLQLGPREQARNASCPAGGRPADRRFRPPTNLRSVSPWAYRGRAAPSEGPASSVHRSGLSDARFSSTCALLGSHTATRVSCFGKLSLKGENWTHAARMVGEERPQSGGSRARPGQVAVRNPASRGSAWGAFAPRGPGPGATPASFFRHFEPRELVSRWILNHCATRISYDPGRFPRYLPEAYCLCRGCLTGPRGEEDVRLRSAPVLVPAVVLRRTPACAGGRAVYTEEYLTIPVGCTCMPGPDKDADGANSSLDKPAQP
ncbi:interleukin-17D isoform X2 [Balaenoptera ricei]|uniref:interleukin-17D isoform X2 n=1 Tax=Balaenoptera ricei TaxID=2746895 RepID=UPI0028BD4996|nr:interleukin-17D isoform X2 [Balaenoptera ricei]